MPEMVALFEAPWSLSIREHGVFEASIHGPGAAAVAARLPYPSMIAGVIASLAYEAGICSEDELRQRLGAAPFGDTEHCIEKLLGSNYWLRTGLLAAPGSKGSRRLLVEAFNGFIAASELQRYLSEAWHNALQQRSSSYKLAEELRTLLKCSNGLHQGPALASATGIALRRDAKTVMKGLLYSREYVVLYSLKERPVKLGYAAILEADDNAALKPPVTRVVSFGGSRRPALLRVAEPDYLDIEHNDLDAVARWPGCKVGETMLLYLASPALLRDTSPWSGVLDAGVSAARMLAETLLREAGLTDYLEPVEPYAVSTTRSNIEVRFPGWSLAANGPRMPMLIVPRGLIVVARAAKCPLPGRPGLGCCTRLGWGTVVAAAAGPAA